MAEFLFRPSASFQFFCSGSTRAMAGLPKPPPSAAAERGSLIHAAVAGALTTGSSIDLVATPALRADPEAMSLAEDALDEIERINTECDQRRIEQFLEIGKAFSERFANLIGGTPDFVGYVRSSRTIRVVDLKTGVQPVPPTAVQLRIYAIGATTVFPDYARVELTVVQPAARDMDGLASHSAVLTRAELEEERRAILDAMEAALEDDAPRTAGPWCRYCPALATCRTAAEHTFGFVASAVTQGLDAKTLEPPVIARIVRDAALTEEFLKAVRTHATETLKGGGTLPQLKLVRGPSSRRVDPARQDDAIAALAAVGADLEVLAPRKIATPAAIERAGHKAAVSEFISSTPGSLRAVHRDNPGKEVPPPRSGGGFNDADLDPSDFDLPSN